MKKIFIGVIALTSISAFANEHFSISGNELGVDDYSNGFVRVHDIKVTDKKSNQALPLEWYGALSLSEICGEMGYQSISGGSTPFFSNSTFRITKNSEQSYSITKIRDTYAYFEILCAPKR